MKNPILRIQLVLTPLFALATAAYSQSASTTAPATEEAIKLPEFTVSETQANAYRPEDTLSLARVAGSLLDTPVSINVVPRQLLDDLGANSTYDASRYMAGVGNGRGAGTAGGINDRTNFRGFESQTRTVDNFSSTFIPGSSTSIDTFEPAFEDRVEIVLGPDAVLNPTGTPGGSMNVVSKSPLYTNQGYVQAEVGNYSAQKFTIDDTGPLPILGDKLAYRVIATGQDTDTYIPGNYKKYDVAAELSYKFNSADILTFKYFGVDYRANGNASAPNDNGWLIYDPTVSIGGATLPSHPTTAGITYNGTNGVDTNSSTQERTNTAQLVYTGTLFNLVSMRLGGQILEQHNVGDSAYPTGGTGLAFANSSSSPSETFNPNTGQVTGITLGGAPYVFDPTHVTEVWRYNENVNVMEQVENDYAANFHPSGVSLQPVTGWSYQHDYAPLTRTGTDFMPQANLLAGDYNAPRPDINLFSFGNRSKSETTYTQFYAFTKAGFFQDRVFVNAGANREWAYSQSYSFALNNLTKPATALPPLRGYKDSYMASGLVKPTENISLYYTFSTNANVSATNPSPQVTVPLWSLGKEHEFGFKSTWFDGRLSFAADHFQISQTNVTTPNPLANIDPVHQPGSILTNNVSRGYEVNVQGGVTKNLSVIASYTDQKYRDVFGRPQRNTPNSLANLLLDYHFTDGELKGFSVFGAVEYFGKAAGETITGSTPLGVPEQPGFYTAAWTVLNGGASYSWSRYRVNLNVDNLLNQKFAWEPASRLSVSPYPGITFRLTTTVTF